MSMTPQPFLLSGSVGPLFCVYFPAARPRGALLYSPPFAEEMNRCRATVAQQARQLATSGYACLLVDPFGTGESAGQLSAATWALWRADTVLAAQWLIQQHDVPITLWGLRLGALLSADVAHHYPDQFKQLLLWQPVLDGQLFLTQYLRLRVAFLMQRDLPRETTDMMRVQLAAGATLEVAGYPLGSALAGELDQIHMRGLTQLTAMNIVWCEHRGDDNTAVAPVTTQLITQLRQQACHVTMIHFTGAPIWSLHKRDAVPELIQFTTQYFAQ